MPKPDPSSNDPPLADDARPSSLGDAEESSPRKASLPPVRGAGDAPGPNAPKSGSDATIDQPSRDPASGSGERTQLPAERRPVRERAPAPAAAASAAADAGVMQARGLVGFACPVCTRPIWVRKRQFGDVVVCEACRSKVRAADPSRDADAEIVEEAPDLTDALRRSTILPDKKSEDLRPPRPARAEPWAEESEPEVDDKADAGPEGGDEGGDPAPADEFAEAGEADSARDGSIHRLRSDRAPKMVPYDEVAASAEERLDDWIPITERPDPEKEARGWSPVQLAAFGLILLMAAIGVIAFFSVPPDIPETEPVPESPVRRLQRLQGGIVERLQEFLAADSIDEMAEHVRHPEKTIPRMKKYYARDTPAPGSLRVEGEPIGLARFERGGKEFYSLVVSLSDGTERGAVFEEVSPGEIRLDWEAFVGFSEMTLAEFLAAEPSEAVTFRLFARPDDYFNFRYSSRDDLLCVQVEDVRRTATCWAYAPVDSPTGLAMKEALAAAVKFGRSRFEAVMKLKCEEGDGDRNQAWIEEFVAAGLLVP